MLKDIITLLKDAQRFFEHYGEYGYVIENMEVESPCWINMIIREKTSTGELKEPISIGFCNGNGELVVDNPITYQSIFDFAEEFGWDEATTNYIRFGKKEGNKEGERE